MSSRRDVTFIIVSYNSDKTLKASITSCLASVQKYYVNTGAVVVYDNASSDDCPKIIDSFANEYPSLFTGIKSNENIGFGRANNKVVQLFPSKTYFLINPDVVFEPEIVNTLTTTLNSANDIAIVCPKLLYLDKSIQPSIRKFPSFTYFLLKNLLGERLQQRLYPFNYYYDIAPSLDSAVEVNWAIGAFMVVSQDYVDRHGLFDERFFLYFEDVSLCVDAWLNGFRVIFQPQVYALHMYQRVSTSSKFNYMKLLHTVSALRFFAKYRPYKKRWQLLTHLLELNLSLKSPFKFLLLTRRWS
ncbi:glucosyltransferase [cyanobacterium TDX16]|nr:glucosyltransferase [cyanobacterium TDX16]